MHFSDSASRPHKSFPFKETSKSNGDTVSKCASFPDPGIHFLQNTRFTESVVRKDTLSPFNFRMSGQLFCLRLTLRGCQYFWLYSVEIQWNTEMLYITSLNRLSQLQIFRCLVKRCSFHFQD